MAYENNKDIIDTSNISTFLMSVSAKAKEYSEDLYRRQSCSPYDYDLTSALYLKHQISVYSGLIKDVSVIKDNKNDIEHFKVKIDTKHNGSYVIDITADKIDSKYPPITILKI